MAPTDSRTLESRARGRARYLAGLVWHTGSFLIINTFLWLLDLLGPGGINWAFWVTAVWAFGLAFHALAYVVDGRQLEERKTQEHLEEHRRREAHQD